jgi:PTS system mannose-specific IIB component
MLSLIRLDDRLIHGQVMAVWVRKLSITRILVIDDATADDEFARTLMQSAMPSHVTLTVAGVADAPALLDALDHSDARALALFARVEDVVEVHRRRPLPHVNVGNLGMRDGRRLIWRSVALSSAEKHALQQLHAAGVDVFVQMIPADQKQRLTEYNPPAC